MANRHTSGAQPRRTDPLPRCPPYSDRSCSPASGSPSPAARTRRSSARLRALGATHGHDVLVHQAPTPATPTASAPRSTTPGTRSARTTLPPPRGLIVLIAPPPGDAHHAAARAGLENLARTLSIEWARHGIRPVAILPGGARPRARSPSSSPSSPRRPARTTPAARSPFASPGHLDRVLRRRVARDDVLRRLGLRAVDARCGSGAAGRRACRPARPSRRSSRWSPHWISMLPGEHVERALAVLVVVRARLRARRARGSGP